MLKSINKIIKILILSDVFLLAGLGFNAPIFAIFIENNIQGGDVKVAGFAASIYWITISLVLIPFGKYLDRNRGEKDDLLFIALGNLLVALAVFGYIFSFRPWHIYFFQSIYAVGIGMNLPGYTAIFTRHIDKGKEAFSWGTRAALVGIGAGISGALGGIIAKHLGFEVLFAGAGVLIIFSAVLPFLISKDIFENKMVSGVPKVKTLPPLAPKE